MSLAGAGCLLQHTFKLFVSVFLLLCIGNALYLTHFMVSLLGDSDIIFFSVGGFFGSLICGMFTKLLLQKSMSVLGILGIEDQPASFKL